MAYRPFKHGVLSNITKCEMSPFKSNRLNTVN